MAGLIHQACGVLDLASASRCPDRALLSTHSNQNEKPDLGQESDAHDRDRKEHVARRERVYECLASCEAPGSKSFRPEKVSFQTQKARDARGAGIRGGLRQSPVIFGLGRALLRGPLYPDEPTSRVSPLPQDIEFRACNRRSGALARGTRNTLVQ